MKAFCVSCRKEQEVNSPIEIIHFGKLATKGTCKKCEYEIICYNRESNE